MSRVLILGGGVAGLAAGIFAAKAGHQVTVCEQHAIAGGNLTGWDRKGYHIDNCIHWLTGTNPHCSLYDLWEELGALGKDIPVYQAPSLYAYEHEGRRIALERDLNSTINRMLTACPKDAKEIIRLRKAVENVMYLENVGGRHHDLGPDVLRLLKIGTALLRYHRYTTTTIEKKFSDPLMKGFFSCMMGPDFSMAAFLYVAATFCSGNGGIPEGSSTAMAGRMADRLISLGGTLLTGKKAVKLNVQGNEVASVTFSDGDEISADHFICTMDPAMLFGSKLKELPMPRSLKRLYENKRFPRFSALHGAYALEGELPFKGTLVLDIPREKRKLLGGNQLILREFSHEKSFAPEGKHLIQTMVYNGEKQARRLTQMAEHREEYLKEKQAMGKAMQQMLEERFPQLQGRLSGLDIWTPASYARYVGTEIGSFMSFVLPAGGIPRSLSQKVPGLKNLVLAGQWLTPPGGLPIAAMQGKQAAASLH
ncbi:MAG: NAD(P)/FAD-dependent oxidoreductase [Lachnospiraceae bacterium]|nr:NAD(P)/FAD-dependent oxidoreductase [Lachnospiraceae bacterium]